ncbi:MAG: agmatine deiminase family protein [Kiloniellales bacterium]|nr:agmatine deiminase family protein [Kiloniellales bacterium]
MTLPVADGFFMPPEWAPHVRCWMAWPCREALWGDRLPAAREACAEVAKEISRFEPVTMVANPQDVAEVSLSCGPGVSCLSLSHDDSWTRDSGPTFVVDRKGGVAGIDWIFNAWGGKYQPYGEDAQMARRILEQLELPCYPAPLVMEGGAIHVDGEGTLLTTEQCLLNRNRNPKLGRDEVEALLRDHLGVETVIWLSGDPLDDETDGHVDNLACFLAPGVVLAQHPGPESAPNHAALSENLKRLREARDARGRALEVVEMPQPQTRLEDHRGAPLLASYVNFYLANGAVLAPGFEDPADQKAYEILRQAFPDREVVQLDALEIVYGGGGIHCITQQQPAPLSEA